MNKKYREKVSKTFYIQRLLYSMFCDPLFIILLFVFYEPLFIRFLFVPVSLSSFIIAYTYIRYRIFKIDRNKGQRN